MVKRHVGAAMLVLALALCLPVCAQAQTPGTYTVLHSFNGTDGANPFGSLIQSGGTLYGMTWQGGTGGYGTIFSQLIAGGAPTTLFDFDSTHGANPRGSLILSGDTLYGMAYMGGTVGVGTIFSEPVAGGTPTTVFSSDGTSHGSGPWGSLIQSGNTFYGTTAQGGAWGAGTIFSEPVAGGTPTRLFSFGPNHGANPHCSLVLSGGTLYGMTLYGGTSNLGTIFSAPVAGGTATTLFSFDDTHGASPYGSLILSGDGGTLYGMTTNGGAHGYGAIFSEPVTGGAPTILFSFDSTHGATPYGSLILSADGSALYGMTEAGGANYDGTIFSEPVTGGTPTTLFDFDNTHGAAPAGSLLLSDNTLYGMTGFGGAYGDGVIFSLVVPEPATLSLLALGGLVILRRRRKAQEAHQGK